jgi:hypothetical protein
MNRPFCRLQGQASISLAVCCHRPLPQQIDKEQIDKVQIDKVTATYFRTTFVFSDVREA